MLPRTYAHSTLYGLFLLFFVHRLVAGGNWGFSRYSSSSSRLTFIEQPNPTLGISLLRRRRKT
jgi:hypothetical protein